MQVLNLLLELFTEVTVSIWIGPLYLLLDADKANMLHTFLESTVDNTHQEQSTFNGLGKAPRRDCKISILDLEDKCQGLKKNAKGCCNRI